MPLTVSVSAFDFERVRRQPLTSIPAPNQIARLRFRHLERQQRFRPESRPCTCSYGTSWADPQKSHRWPTCAASKTEIAWQLWHRTDVFSACHPRALVGNAAQRRRQVVLDDDGLGAARLQHRRATSVPQNGQTSACFAGFQWASAPQAGQ